MAKKEKSWKERFTIAHPISEEEKHRLENYPGRKDVNLQELIEESKRKAEQQKKAS